MAKEPASKKLGRKVAEIRKQKGFTQRDLATLAGTSHAQIWNIETGNHSVNVDLLDNVLNVLDCQLTISPIIKSIY